MAPTLYQCSSTSEPQAIKFGDYIYETDTGHLVCYDYGPYTQIAHNMTLAQAARWLMKAFPLLAVAPETVALRSRVHDISFEEVPGSWEPWLEWDDVMPEAYGRL